MKILFILPTLGTGGAERVASILANSLCNDFDNIELLLTEESNVEKYSLNSRIRVVELGFSVRHGNRFKSFLNYAKNFKKQRKLLEKEIAYFEPTTIISFLPKIDFLLSKINLKNIKWIASERNDPTARSLLQRLALLKAYKKCNVLVVQTKKIDTYYKKRGITNTCIISNPVSRFASDSLQKKANPIGLPYILSVGRLDKQKAFDKLILAYYKLKRTEAISHKLVILGDGPLMKKLKKMVFRFHLDADVLLLGRKKEVEDFYLNASLFVLPSKYEGMPNALLEAMSFGLPVISTDFFTGAAQELISNNNGIIVPVNNNQSLQKAILSILSLDNYERDHMGQRSIDVLKRFSTETVVKKWKELIV